MSAQSPKEAWHGSASDKRLERLACEAAKGIHANTDKIVQTVLERLEKGSTRKNPSSPLILLLGEAHYDICDMITQVQVMDALREAGLSLMSGIEVPHDTASKAFDSDPDFRALWQEDPEFFIAAAFGSPSAKFSSLLVRFNTFVYGIPQFYCDASIKDKYLDLSDDLTRNAAEQDDIKISTVSAEGVRIRNLVMGKISATFAEKHKPDALILRCGGLHVAGGYFSFNGLKGLWNRRKDIFPFEDSLLHIFEDQGYDVIGTCGHHPSIDDRSFHVPKETKNHPSLIELAHGQPQMLYMLKGFSEEYVLSLLLPHVKVDGEVVKFLHENFIRPEMSDEEPEMTAP